MPEEGPRRVPTEVGFKVHCLAPLCDTPSPEKEKVAGEDTPLGSSPNTPLSPESVYEELDSGDLLLALQQSIALNNRRRQTHFNDSAHAFLSIGHELLTAQQPPIRLQILALLRQHQYTLDRTTAQGYIFCQKAPT
ncbi:MAG: hypothetical protein EOO40_10150 [Deltaproteobacteria bacterium]|nr:MAG: hypothetical protein EOO40_10150 [Deltaproteobacteria bacterium]